MADGKTAYEKICGEEFDGPLIPVGAKDSYIGNKHPEGTFSNGSFRKVTFFQNFMFLQDGTSCTDLTAMSMKQHTT